MAIGIFTSMIGINMFFPEAIPPVQHMLPIMLTGIAAFLFISLFCQAALISALVNEQGRSSEQLRYCIPEIFFLHGPLPCPDRSHMGGLHVHVYSRRDCSCPFFLLADHFDFRERIGPRRHEEEHPIPFGDVDSFAASICPRCPLHDCRPVSLCLWRQLHFVQLVQHPDAGNGKCVSLSAYSLGHFQPVHCNPRRLRLHGI